MDDLWLEITQASVHKNKNIYPILEIKANDIIRLGEATMKILSVLSHRNHKNINKNI